MSDTSLNKYLAQGDDAAEAGFTPDPVTGTTPEQAVLFVNSEDPMNPALKWWDGANFVAVAGGGGGIGGSTGGTDEAVLVADGTGGSTLQAIGRVRDAGYQVVRVVALVDREEGGREAVEQQAPLSALFSRRDFLADPA